MSNIIDSNTAQPIQQTKSSTPLQRIGTLLNSVECKNKLAASLSGFNVAPDRFMRTAMSALVSAPYVVQKCSAGSIVAAVLRAATLNLNLDPLIGEAHIVPRGNQAVLQRSARGVLNMAYRTGRLIGIEVGEICQNDVVHYVRGTTPALDISPSLVQPRGPAIAYYCAAQWLGGGKTVGVMTVKEIEEHRDRFSDEWKRRGANSIWGQNFPEMAKKTVLLRSSKTWPIGVGDDDDDHAYAHRPMDEVGQLVEASSIDQETGEITPAKPLQAANPYRSSRLSALI